MNIGIDLGGSHIGVGLIEDERYKKLKDKINKVANFTSLDISKVQEEFEEFGALKSYKDE